MDVASALPAMLWAGIFARTVYFRATGHNIYLYVVRAASKSIEPGIDFAVNVTRSFGRL